MKTAARAWRYKQSGASKIPTMWELTPEDLRKAWLSELPDAESGCSLSATRAAKGFLTDASHLIPANDLLIIPGDAGDETRADLCLKWLIKVAVSIWVPYWVNYRHQTNAWADSERLSENLNEIEAATELEDLADAVQGIHWYISGFSKIHRRSVILAQEMGIRAVLLGATAHTNKSVHMVATTAAECIVRLIPNLERREGDKLVQEATAGSALRLLDELLLERGEDGTPRPASPGGE